MREDVGQTLTEDDVSSAMCPGPHSPLSPPHWPALHRVGRRSDVVRDMSETQSVRGWSHSDVSGGNGLGYAFVRRNIAVGNMHKTTHRFSMGGNEEKSPYFPKKALSAILILTREYTEVF